MPDYWYSYRANVPKDDDTDEDRVQKEFNLRILAEKKPYFMIYVYPSLKAEYRKYVKSADQKVIRMYSVSHGLRSIEDIYNYDSKDEEMESMLSYYERLMPIGMNECVINRISWLVERAFPNLSSCCPKVAFDYEWLKCGVGYNRKIFNEIARQYAIYKEQAAMVARTAATEKMDRYYNLLERKKLEIGFDRECAAICTNEQELCDIVLDMCYQHENSKQFAWEICGNVIIENLLAVNGNTILYPQKVNEDGEFTYCGKQFIMLKKKIGDDNYDYT